MTTNPSRPIKKRARIVAMACAAGALLLAGCSTADNSSGDAAADTSSVPSESASAAPSRVVNGVEIPGNVGIQEDDMKPMEDFCGDKQITVGYVDSNAGVNSWRKITKAELMDEAAKCPNITDVITTDGQGSLEKTISDIQGLVAQGVGALVVLTDFGDPTMPAIRQAMQAGIPVTLINYPHPAGTKGKDYTDTVNADDALVARVQTEWLIKNAAGDTCNILHVGGSAGNPLSAAVTTGIQAAMKEHPDCKLLNDEPLTSDWNPADEQKAVAGALVKYPQIDGVYNECGTCAPGGWKAFVEAGRPLVPWVSDDVNELSCTFGDLKPDNPNFQMLTVSARTWVVRVALHKAVAAAEGLTDDEPSDWLLSTFEDSTNPKMQPQCHPDAPPSAIFSSLLSDEQVIKAVS
ncbi:substrate-binding domain-containing protein [Nocardioides sp.]|uniref:substrate-binding domain-containing protein n=1 Tax=Nocardioides sp. TaxID=35761 RepID=UPI003784D1F5